MNAYARPRSKSEWTKRIEPAVAQLKIALDIVKTNEPINRRGGNIGQANLERTNAASYMQGIKALEGLR